jgi:PPOX class probable F420-dependent enzyme
VDDVDPRALDLLSRPILGQLGFLGLDGYPHVLAVWFEYRDGEILIGSRPNEYKCRSLRAVGRAALTVSTPDWPYTTVTAVGDASVEPLPEARRKEFIDAMAHRYLGRELGDRYYERWSKGGHPGDGELIRLRPKRIRFYDVSGVAPSRS